MWPQQPLSEEPHMVQVGVRVCKTTLGLSPRVHGGVCLDPDHVQHMCGARSASPRAAGPVGVRPQPRAEARVPVCSPKAPPSPKPRSSAEPALGCSADGEHGPPQPRAVVGVAGRDDGRSWEFKGSTDSLPTISNGSNSFGAGARRNQSCG